jgi:hypothetical protein
MHCFKAPSPPSLRPPPLPIRTHSSPLQLPTRSSPRNPITWQYCDPEPSHRKAIIPPVLADTLYFAERPRGLRKATFSALNRSTLELGSAQNRSALELGLAQKIALGRKRVDSPLGDERKQRPKRRIEGRKARNPILQDDPSFLPKPRRVRPDWRPSVFVEGENWKRSGGTTDLWASQPAGPKQLSLR